MTFQVDIPDSVIHEAAVRAWKDSFRTPEYVGRTGGDGYEVILAEVKMHLASGVVVEAIRECVHRQAAILAEPVVRTCVTEELRRMVKKVVMEEKSQQTLFKEASCDANESP